jgi:hypothetical protein
MLTTPSKKDNPGVWRALRKSIKLSTHVKPNAKSKPKRKRIRRNEEVVQKLFDSDDWGGAFAVGKNTRSRYKKGHGYRVDPELDKSPTRAGRGSTKSFILTGEQDRGIEVLTENHKFPYALAHLVTDYMEDPQQRFEERKELKVTKKISKGTIDKGVPVTTVYTPVVLLEQGDEAFRIPSIVTNPSNQRTDTEPLDDRYYNFMNKKRPNSNMGLVLQARQNFMRHVSERSSMY